MLSQTPWQEPHMTSRLLRKVVSRADNENAGQRESPSVVASETELAARPIVKVREAWIVVSRWRPPIRSIGGALTESRHGVAVLAEVPPMGISLRGNCHRTKRNCRARDKCEGSFHHRHLPCPQPTF